MYTRQTAFSPAGALCRSPVRAMSAAQCTIHNVLCCAAHYAFGSCGGVVYDILYGRVVHHLIHPPISAAVVFRPGSGAHDEHIEMRADLPDIPVRETVE